jgi:hypothetical protein
MIGVQPDVTAEPSTLLVEQPPQGKSAWFIVIVAASACLLVSVAAGTHIGLVLVTLPIVVALVWQSPRTAVTVLPVWMVMLGLVRRLTPGGGNITLSGDPVLLIGPIIILLLFFTALARGGFQNRTRLASVVASFSALAFVEAFNPKQGSLLTGLSGLLFILVPMLAFWIGRCLLEEYQAIQLVKTVAVLALLSAIYGLFQEFHGLPSWDASWIQSKGYAALNVGSGVIRAFGPFSSAEEYAAFLTVGLVAWIALGTKKGARMFPPLHLAATITVAVALWYESERTAVFLAALAIGVMVAARLRLRPWGVVLGGAGAIGLLIVFAGHLGGGGGSGASASTVLTIHLRTGITGPFSSGSSLPGHIRATRIGILEAFKDPLGHGTGVITPASTRYGKSGSVGTEFDPGNMGIAFGVLGLALYVAIFWYAIKTAYRSAVVRRDVVSVFVIGALMGVLFQWTNGDLYSVCWLIWLFLGYLDISMQRHDAEEALAPPPALAPALAWRRPGEGRRIAPTS